MDLFRHLVRFLLIQEEDTSHYWDTGYKNQDVYKRQGYTLENENDFVQGNKVEITNIYMEGLE